MRVIGIAGQARNGKDVVANQLADQLNAFSGGDKRWKRTAFAANVKKVLSDWFDVDYQLIEEWKVESEPPPGFDMTIRKALQWIGDGFRQIRSTIWIDLIFRDEEPKIVSDVRYVNEFRAIRNHEGFNLLIARPDQLNDSPHPSEAEIRPYVEYALENLTDGPMDRYWPGSNYRTNQFRRYDYDSNSRQLLPNPPEYMCDFDYFLLNDGTMEELYTKVREKVVPYIRQFNFEN